MPDFNCSTCFKDCSGPMNGRLERRRRVGTIPAAPTRSGWVRRGCVRPLVTPAVEVGGPRRASKLVGAAGWPTPRGRSRRCSCRQPRRAKPCPQRPPGALVPSITRPRSRSPHSHAVYRPRASGARRSTTHFPRTARSARRVLFCGCCSAEVDRRCTRSTHRAALGPLTSLPCLVPVACERRPQVDLRRQQLDGVHATERQATRACKATRRTYEQWQRGWWRRSIEQAAIGRWRLGHRAERRWDVERGERVTVRHDCLNRCETAL